MPYLAFLVSVAFVPLFYTGAIAPRWSVLAVGVSLLLCFTKVRWSTPHTLLTALLCWCAYVGFQSPYLYDAIPTLAALLTFGGVFMLAARQKDGQNVVIGLSVGVAVNALITLNQYFDWPVLIEYKWGDQFPPGGLFANRNMVAELAALTLVGCFVYRFWYGVPMSLLALFTSWSRTAFVAIGAAGVVWLWKRDRILAGAVVLFGVCMVPAVIKVQPYSVDERRVIWTDTIKAVTWTGAGLGSFAQNYPLLSSHQTMQEWPENAHNDYLELVYETGVVGLALFLTFLGYLFVCAGFDRPLLTVMLVEAFFAFPLHMPVSLFMFGAVAGLCAARRVVYRLPSRDGVVATHDWEAKFEPGIVGTSRAGPSLVANLSQSGVAWGDGPYAKRLARAAPYGIAEYGAIDRSKFLRPVDDQIAIVDCEPCGFATNQRNKV